MTSVVQGRQVYAAALAVSLGDYREFLAASKPRLRASSRLPMFQPRRRRLLQAASVASGRRVWVVVANRSDRDVAWAIVATRDGRSALARAAIAVERVGDLRPQRERNAMKRCRRQLGVGANLDAEPTATKPLKRGGVERLGRSHRDGEAPTFDAQLQRGVAVERFAASLLAANADAESVVSSATAYKTAMRREFKGAVTTEQMHVFPKEKSACRQGNTRGSAG